MDFKWMKQPFRNKQSRLQSVLKAGQSKTVRHSYKLVLKYREEVGKFYSA